ncbi:uroplakin-3b [Trichomycterus rosablanca]|uniref:uroplakin-3b n=1 Tax=Trichomycterus rosablanca TaxID=2290929 RepID=UPI002F34F5F8
MKAYLLLVWLGCIMPLGILAQVNVDCKPNLSPDVSVPVTTNSVFLTQPKCCFDSVTNLCSNSACDIWLASALDSATNTFDADKNNTNNYEVCPCSPGFDNTSKNYFLIKAGAYKDFPCDSKNPNIFKVGGESVCPSSTCTGVLPEGNQVCVKMSYIHCCLSYLRLISCCFYRYKYLLVDPVSKKPVAETAWSSSTLLKTVKDPSTIGSGYAGRSAAMVVITSILSAVAGLLLVGLLGALIYTCCCRGGKAQNYTTRTTKPTKRQPSLIGSLRIPTYDVHHLKNPSPYDNPAYERDTKRYTTSTTLPKGAATTIIQPSSPENIRLQNLGDMTFQTDDYTVHHVYK